MSRHSFVSNFLKERSIIVCLNLLKISLICSYSIYSLLTLEGLKCFGLIKIIMARLVESVKISIVNYFLRSDLARVRKSF